MRSGGADMPRLFEVRTHGEMLTRPDRLVGFADATIHWFREGRTEPAFPYTWTVPGWEDMVFALDPHERNPGYARRLAAYVDQLLTEEEAQALKEYFLRTSAAELEIRGIDVPLTDFEIPYRLIPPEPAEGENYGFITLSDGTNGPLPFRVTGYFDMDYPSAFERYQAAAVKSLMESSGLCVNGHDCVSGADLDELCEKLNSLRLALISLQQSLKGLTRKAPDVK